MPIKRAILMKLADMDRVEFDKCVRLDQLPFDPSGADETVARLDLPRGSLAADREDRLTYTLRDALQLVVAQDLARSYWSGGHEPKRRSADLAGASRLVANGWRGVEDYAEVLSNQQHRHDLWLFALRTRPACGEIHEEAPAIGTIRTLMTAVANSVEGDAEPSRILAVNLSASLRLFRARAAELGVDIPPGADWIVKRI